MIDDLLMIVPGLHVRLTCKLYPWTSMEFICQSTSFGWLFDMQPYTSLSQTHTHTHVHIHTQHTHIHTHTFRCLLVEGSKTLWMEYQPCLESKYVALQSYFGHMGQLIAHICSYAYLCFYKIKLLFLLNVWYIHFLYGHENNIDMLLNCMY